MKRFLRWPNWKTKAVTLSYDDAVVEDVRLVSIMQKYGLKGTFNVNGGQLNGTIPRRMRLEQAKKLYEDAGMEVGMHGYDHAFPASRTGADIISEFYEDKKALEKMFNTMIRGGAYAYGAYNDDIVNILRILGIKYFRCARENSYSFNIPTDWLRLVPTCAHRDPKLMQLVDEFLALPVNKVYYGEPLLFYLWGHSYEFEDNNNWEIIENFGKKFANNDDVWHATNIEIYDYVKAYEDLEFTVDGGKVLNKSAIDVYLRKDGKDVIAKANSISEI